MINPYLKRYEEMRELLVTDVYGKVSAKIIEDTNSNTKLLEARILEHLMVFEEKLRNIVTEVVKEELNQLKKNV